MEHAIELRAALRGAPGPCSGSGRRSRRRSTAEVAAAGAGADYVVVDQQHGAVDPAASAGHAPGDPARRRRRRSCAWRRERRVDVGHALDLGAIGVIVPMVDSPEEAARAVGASATRPRGCAPSACCGGTSGAGAPEPPLCLVMVETRTALEGGRGRSRRRQGSTAGSIGPSDLSLSLGLQPTGRLDATGARHSARPGGCKAADRLCGLHCLTAQDAARFGGDGFALITMGGDLAYLRTALDTGAHGWRGAADARAARASGSTTSTASPPCGRGASATRPPWRSATARTIDRPSRTPRPSRARPPRSNGSRQPLGRGGRHQRPAVDHTAARRAPPPPGSARPRGRRARCSGRRSGCGRGRPLRRPAARRARAPARERTGDAGCPPPARRTPRPPPRARGRAARPPAAGARSARAPSGPPSASISSAAPIASRPIARSSATPASGSARATSASVRITVSGLRSSWLCVGHEPRLGVEGGRHGAPSSRPCERPAEPRSPAATRRPARAGTASRAAASASSASEGGGSVRSRCCASEPPETPSRSATEQRRTGRRRAP